MLRCPQDSSCDFTFIKGIASAISQQAQCVAVLGIAEEIAFPRRLSVRKIRAARLLFGLEPLNIGGYCPSFLDGLRHGIALFRVRDRRLEQVFPGEFTETLVHLGPTINRAWYGNSVNAVSRH